MRKLGYLIHDLVSTKCQPAPNKLAGLSLNNLIRQQTDPSEL